MTLWGGRFSQELDDQAWDLNASLPIDQRMSRQDVAGSLAWAQALYQAGVLVESEHQEITNGLAAVQEEFIKGEFIFSPSDEDIHTAVERRLRELVGPVAGKLHTGRSRNDQVATDFRMWIMQQLPQLDAAIAGLQTALVDRAAENLETLMPGYTHLQRAQPVTLAHWLLAHFWAFQRDRQRLSDLGKRLRIMPLGCGALAGTPVTVDREALAASLGFDQPAQNSIDAVSDRDFAAEFLFCSALAGVHLSKLAEGVVLYSTAEFGFFELSDAYSTGSSLMPQKKNPDVFELARGKAGILIGQLTGLLAVLKSLPSAYDKDLQEDKAPVFAAADTLMMVFPVMANAFKTMSFHPERMRQAVDSFMMATDLADYLVARGVPFRETHTLAGKAVRLAVETGVGLHELELKDLQSIHPAFEDDVYAVFDPLVSVSRRKATGGTAPEAVSIQIELAKKELQGPETIK